ncbi:uncharacterized protein K02A2.6-like [Sardina pilchardus]|uniref:uncharacterized protein K02A2.6-like n=1 Tax=Sardina pilchardus TaxID=27697 RepID=UPI002E14DF21
MSHAYAQILVDEDSKKYLTVNTLKGLFTYNRLPYGVSSAPAVFQRTMENLLQGIPMVAVYLDDILVTGENVQAHLKNLAEVLSRLEKAGLRLKRTKCELLKDEVCYLGHKVRKWTARDVTLSQVHNYVLSGWPEIKDPQLMPYYSRKLELSAQDGCILWGARTVIPQQGRVALLKSLHQSHPGVSRMKALARSYVWWPRMDQDIEREVSMCEECQQNRKAPPNAPLHPWEWPERPWSRIHIDYAGPFLGRMFLIIVDAHSKWIDVYPTNSSTSQITIEKLRHCFAAQGLPQIVVSDNGSCFTSSDFDQFMTQNGIQHITSAPFHPSSNGLAERAVQTFKEGVKKLRGGSIETRVSRFLFSYRITPQATTGLSPAEMLMNRRLRSAFDLLKPDIKSKIQQRQLKQKENHDKTTRLRRFSPGDAVYTRNYGLGPKWVPATVESPTGPVSYTVILGNGQRMRRHVDQVRARHPESSSSLDKQTEPPEACSREDEPGTSMHQPNAEPQPPDEQGDQQSAVPERLDLPVNPPAELRRSARERVSPQHLEDYIR